MLNVPFSSGSHVVLIGGKRATMESWTPLNFTPPAYNPLPPGDYDGLAAAQGWKLMSCSHVNRLGQLANLASD